MRSQMNKFTFYGNYSKALALTCMLLANNGYSAEEKDSFSDDEGSSIRRYVTTSAQEQRLQEEAANAALIRQIEAEDREFQAYQEDVRRRTEEARQLAIHRADVKRAAAEVPFAETEVQLGLLLEAKRINNFGEVSPTFSSLADFFEGEAGTRARLFSIYQELYSQHGDSDSAIATMATDFRDGRLL